MPLLRYRTRDLTRLMPGECPCGRTHVRVDRIEGRSDDMFIIKGCNVFPIQIERVLMRLKEVGSDYLIVLDREGDTDEITVQVEVHQDGFTGAVEDLERLRQRIVHVGRDEILVTPRVQLVEPGALPKSEGKAVRVRDLRKEKGV
jgi:phenylacetate-CoA ligase